MRRRSMWATSPLALVDLGVEPGLDGCPAVSNMTADSVAGRALTAVPPPVKGVNRHAEHLRQVGDRQQSIKLVGHFSPTVLARGDWSGKPPTIASFCRRPASLRPIARAWRSRTYRVARSACNDA